VLLVWARINIFLGLDFSLALMYIICVGEKRDTINEGEKKMSASYYNVSLTEMKTVLQSEKGWSLVSNPQSSEYIFSFPLSNSPHIQVRVCSGITSNGKSRGCGKDAIRVFAVDTLKNKGYISTKRVYRLDTWEKNLRNAVTNCFVAAKARRDR
jgi:hypothetical protein